MTAKKALALLCPLLLLSSAWTLAPPLAGGAVEGKLIKSLNVEGTPIDVAMSADGQSFYLLTDRGEVLICSPDGTLKERLKLEEPADEIAVTPRGEALILSSRETKTVRVVLLEFIRAVNAAGSPSRGPEDAPVVVAVFTDFQ